MTIDIDHLEAAAKAATPGPWENGGDRIYYDGEPGTIEDLIAYISSANPAVVLELIAELRAKNELLEEIFDDCGGKDSGACPVCHIYTHKKWCWYPHLAKMLGKPLDENDKRFFADLQKYESLK